MYIQLDQVRLRIGEVRSGIWLVLSTAASKTNTTFSGGFFSFFDYKKRFSSCSALGQV